MSTPLEHRERGQALRLQGRHAEAIAAFTDAAQAAQALGDALLAARVQVGSIDSLGMLGRYAEAEALAAALEQTFTTHGESVTAGKVIFNLGALHYRQEQYAAALVCFARAGERFASAPQAAALLPHVWTNTALALTFLDRTDEALALYQKALAAFQATEQWGEAATVEANIGFVHQVSGRYGAALAALNPARLALEAQGRLHDAARYAIDAGDAYRALNLLPEAQECYDQALAIFAQHPLPYDEARALLGRATTQPTGLADTDLEEAERRFQALQARPQQAHVQLLKAQRALVAGSRDEARLLAERAQRTFARAGLRGWAAEAALVATEAGVPNLRRLCRLRRVAQQTGRGWLECRVSLALGTAYAAQGKTTAALRHLRASVAALETARGLLAQEEIHTAFLRDKLGVYEALVGLLLERGAPGDIAEALEQVERSRSRLLLERVLAAVASDTPVLPGALQEKLTTLRAQLSRAYHREIALGESEARRLTLTTTLRLETLERTYQQLLRELELVQTSAPSPLTPPVRAEALCRRLCPDQGLVEYYQHQGKLGAFVLTHSGVRFVPNLCELPLLEATLRRLRFYLQAAVPDAGIQSVLQRLYDQLLRPLEGLLPTEKLVLIPQGVLHRVPFQALHDGT